MNRTNDDSDVTVAIVWGLGLVVPPISLVLPAAYHLTRWWKRGAPAREAKREQRGIERRREAEERERQRRIEAERQRLAALPPPPPPPAPPTRAALAAAARERYQATLQTLQAAGLDAIELHAACAQAKQQYLRELARVMQ